VLFLAQPAAPGHGPRIEFLFPYHAYLLQQRIGAGCQRDILHANIQLHGVKGSVGHGLERLCRPHAHRLFGCSPCTTVLVMERQAPLAEAADGTQRPFQPGGLLNTVIEWRQQVGLEDFVLVADDDDRSLIHVDAWQCKSPEVGTITRCGDDAAVTAAIIATRALTAATDPIKYLAHTVAKARWGFCALIGILHKAAQHPVPADPPLRFSPRLLHLCTTAVLDPDAHAAASEPVPLPRAFVEAYNGSTKARSTAAPCPDLADASFTIVVHDGLDWVAELLPGAHSDALTSPTLRSRVDDRRRSLAAAAAGAGGARAPARR